MYQFKFLRIEIWCYKVEVVNW